MSLFNLYNEIEKEYENLIVSGIQDCLKQLGFDNSQLIFSGLSMGTFGAISEFFTTFFFY